MAALLFLGVAAPSATAQTLINGAGATFPAPLYQKWFQQYRSVNSGVQINYQAMGSGGGIKQVTQGTVDFGATDGPMSDQQIGKANIKVLHFPTVLGAVVPIYNIPGLKEEINFTPAALAGIYLGTVTKWNHPEIAKVNPQLKLPNEDIIILHRSDGSGTTYCFTDYLSKISAEWNSQVGKNTSVYWPVGLGAKGNDGISGLIRQLPYSIGYVELLYAANNKMSYGRVQNAAGKFMKADLASVTAAAASVAQSMPEDFRVSITNAPGETAYPISTFTWLLIPKAMADSTKKAAILDFLKWMLAEGQESAEPLQYAKLPKEVVEKERKSIALIR